MSVVQHGKWKFDYNPGKFIYKINKDTIENNHFKSDDSINTYLGDDLSDYRKAAIIHRLVRSNILRKIHDGVSFLEIIKEADDSVSKFIKDGDGGFAFPLGISVNEIMAHDTAMLNDERKLKKNDIVKIDLGIHINGCIIDSAFTTIVDGDPDVNSYYDPLIQATKDATYTGICLSGVDAELYDISEAIQEVIESYELEDGTPIRAVRGLGGHDILPYRVHGKKLILCVPHKSQENIRMNEGEFYAVETYASTGNGNCKMKSIEMCNHFMINENVKMSKQMKKNPVVECEETKNNSLPFTQRQIANIKQIQKHMNEGVRNRSIVAYPPLIDKKGSMTSQFEHTIHIKKESVEILSLGEDY